MNLLFSKTETKIKNNSILNPILFNLCFLDINDIIEETIQLINILESNSIKYNKQQSEAMTQGMYKELKESKDNEEFYQKQKLIEFLNISFCSTESDIIYSFSLIWYVIKFRNITFRQKEILWNLLSTCTSHNTKSLYSYLDIQNQKFENYLDDNIKNILQCIFNNFNKDELTEFTQNQLNLFDNNKEEYCRKVFVYERLFANMDFKKSDQFMYDLCQPIINEPIFLWDKEKREDFFYELIIRYNKNSEINDSNVSQYVYNLLKKIDQNGDNLYDFIDFFINKEQVFENFKYLNITISKNFPNNIYDLIEKYPPKDENEEKIKKTFKKYYPKK